MSLQEWIDGTKRRFDQQPPITAAAVSAREFARGVVRRTLDPTIGRSIWSRGDWDICLVLDAARTDLMREAAAEYDELPGMDTVWSNASCSIDWIDRQFNGRKDTSHVGYVTANPWTSHDCDGVESADVDGQVGHLRKLYETDWQETHGVETVPPEVVTDHAIDAWRRREELGIERLVVHYMQPHEPYRSRPEWGSGDHALLEDLVDGDGENAGASIFPRVQRGEVSVKEFRDVYLDNHHWVLEDVTARLLENVDGDVAITADHGNGLGEWGVWHHPPADVTPAVRRVPWIEVESRDEKTVLPNISSTGTEASTLDQLEALGYR